MRLSALTTRELVLMVDNLPNPTPLEKELADRLDSILAKQPTPPTPNPQQEIQYE